MDHQKNRQDADLLDGLAGDLGEGFKLRDAMRNGARALRSEANRPASSGTVDEEDLTTNG